MKRFEFTYHPRTFYVEFVGDPSRDGYYAIPNDADFTVSDDEDDLVEVTNRKVPEGFRFLSLDHEDARAVLALKIHRGEFEDLVTLVRSSEFEVGRCRWLVVTDDDADQELDTFLRREFSSIGIPEQILAYVDSESWLYDQRSYGRGELAIDGVEHTVTVDNIPYFIYRRN